MLKSLEIGRLINSSSLMIVLQSKFTLFACCFLAKNKKKR